MTTNTDHLDQCIKTLETSLAFLEANAQGTIEYEVFRNAVVKGFELTLETSGKLLRKAVKSYGASVRSVDALPFKDVFRTAVKHGLLENDETARWFAYRDNRNDTAHDYGLSFAEETLKLLPSLIDDAKALSERLKRHFAANP